MFQQDVESWINGYLAERVPERNNLPRCPFAKKALDQKRIAFEEVQSADGLYNIIEYYQSIWGEDSLDAVVINLDFFSQPKYFTRLGNLVETYYGATKTDNMFIYEQQLLNGRMYNMILMHTYSDMQVAKRKLRKLGYFKEETA